MNGDLCLLVTVLYLAEGELLRCALRVPRGALPQAAADAGWLVGPEAREAVRPWLPAHVASCGPVVELEPLFEIAVIVEPS